MTNATTPNAYVETCTEYLAIILINGGSSWANAGNAFEAIEDCKRLCEQDWGSLYRLDGTALIHVYDYTEATGFIADHRGVLSRDTKKPLPFLFTVTCKLENTAEQKRRTKLADRRKGTGVRS